MQENFNEIISTIAIERSLDESTVQNLLKEKLLDFAAKKYGNQEMLNMSIDSNGAFELFIEREVVSDEPQGFHEIQYIEALKRNKNTKTGDFIKEVLPFTLESFEVLKLYNELKIELRKLQKEKEYSFFFDKIHTMAIGYVQRIDRSEAIISFPDNSGEGVLPRSKMLPNDTIQKNTYIKVFIEDLRKNTDKQVLLSRTHPNFLKELLKSEITEISEGLVTIQSIARDPGSLSKVSVYTNRLSIDPIKVCIGERGSKIHSISKELAGERISFVKAAESDNVPQNIANAFYPSKVLKVTETSSNRYDVVVASEDFSKAMGRGAQNVHLVKKLCKVASITLLTAEQDQENSKQLIEKQSKDLIENLQIEEMMAHLLISENFDTAEIIANSTIQEIASLNGFDDELAKLLVTRADKYLITEKENFKQSLLICKKDISLFSIDMLTTNYIKILNKHDILSKHELAMLDAMELIDIFDKENLNLEFDIACKIITTARNIKPKEEHTK